MATVGLVGFSLVSFADAALVQNDLTGLSPLTKTSGDIYGITLAPLGGPIGLFAYYDSSGAFVLDEAGPYYIYLDNFVPLGTDLTTFTTVSSEATFQLTNPSGNYYFPVFWGNGNNNVSYITTVYDNPSQTLSFVSSTVQDTPGETIVVVPEVSSALLAFLGALPLLARRRH